MIKVQINNHNLNFTAQYTILQAGVNSGVLIPKFCYHPRLSIAANCRMCLVQLEHSVKLVAACAMSITNNIKVTTNSAVVKKAREAVLEFLLINHPLDCPICDQGGECDLQDQTIIYGGDRGRFYEKKRAVADINLGSVVKTFMSRCIHCTRCIRFMAEISKTNELGLIGRGNNMRVSTFLNKTLKSYLSGNIADICPVGALTSKPYAFSVRPWEVSKKFTINPYDIFGENIRVDFKGVEVVRVLPFEKYSLPSEWISDKTRLFFDGALLQRVQSPFYYAAGKSVFFSWNQIFFVLSYVIKTWVLCLFIERLLSASQDHPKFRLLQGSGVDLEAVSFLKTFNSITFVTKSFEFNGNSPEFFRPIFKKSYLLSTYLGQPFTSIVVLVNLVPLIEAISLDLQIKKIQQTQKTLVFSIGFSTYQSSNNTRETVIGVTTKNITAIIKGRHNLCRLLAIREFGVNNSNRAFMLIGSAVAQRLDGLNHFHKLFIEQGGFSRFFTPKLISKDYTQLNNLEIFT